MSQKIPQQSMNQQGGPGTVLKQNEINEEQYMRLPPNLIRIRADDNDKKIMITFWVVFISVFVFMAFLMLAVPNQLMPITNQQQLQNTSLENCTNPSDYNNATQTFICNNFSIQNPKVGLFLLNLRDLNQFFFLFIEIYLKNQSTLFSSLQPIRVQQYNLALEQVNNTPSWVLDQKLYDSIFLIQIDIQDSTQIQPPRGGRREDNSMQQKIYRKMVAYEYDTDSHQNQFITLQFQAPQTLTNIQKIQMIGVTINPQFSLFTILLRYFCLIGSLISGIIYILRFKDVPLEHRTIQQRLVLVQTILLWFFNDPLYPATILKPNGFLTFYSVFVVVNFVVFLIYSWMMFIDRILYQNGKKETQLLNWKKFVYIGIIYILAMVLLCLVAFYHMGNKPIIPQYDITTGNFLVLSIITLVIVLLGFVYIFIQYIRCCTDYYGKIWRNQLYLVFVIFFIVLVVGLIIFDGFNIFNLVGRRILLIFTVMNVYTFYMQYMYSVTRMQIQRIRSGQSYIDDRKQVKSILSDMNYGQIQLDMQSESGLQKDLNGAGLKQAYLSSKIENGGKKLLSNNQDDELSQNDNDKHNDFKSNGNGNAKKKPANNHDFETFQLQD